MIDNGLYVDKVTDRNSSMTGFTVPTASVIQIAPGSAKRKRITFINSGTSVVNIFQNSVFDVTRFIPIPVAGGVLTMDYDDYGTLIQQPWFAQANTASSNFGVIDTVGT